MGEDEEDAGEGCVTIGGIFEIALSDWGVEPRTIFKKWTLSQLSLLIRKRNERVEIQNGGGEEDEGRRGPLDMDQLKATQQERFEVWKRLHKKVR